MAWKDTINLDNWTQSNVVVASKTTYDISVIVYCTYRWAVRTHMPRHCSCSGLSCLLKKRENKGLKKNIRVL